MLCFFIWRRHAAWHRLPLILGPGISWSVSACGACWGYACRSFGWSCLILSNLVRPCSVLAWPYVLRLRISWICKGKFEKRGQNSKKCQRRCGPIAFVAVNTKRKAGALAISNGNIYNLELVRPCSTWTEFRFEFSVNNYVFQHWTKFWHFLRLCKFNFFWKM